MDDRHDLMKSVERYVQDRLYTALAGGHELSHGELSGLFESKVFRNVGNLMAHNHRLYTWDSKKGVILNYVSYSNDITGKIISWTWIDLEGKIKKYESIRDLKKEWFA